MCGISGILKLHGGLADSDQLSGMISTLAHRGPDASAIYRDGPVGLAHARLSIIDLEGGAQPMSIADGTLWITFNGEIFNYIELRDQLISKGHKFRTRSDTEVILHLYQEYGEECVHRLNGQWAFAIWDAPRRKLFLSRDRMGVRPLFYTQTRDAFLFASEIKALLACPEVKRRTGCAGARPDLHVLGDGAATYGVQGHLAAFSRTLAGSGRWTGAELALLELGIRLGR